MPDEKARIATYYDQQSQSYNEGYSDAVSKLEDEQITRILTQLLTKFEHPVIYDVGAGSALLAHLLVGIPHTYFGFELSGKMCAMARTTKPDLKIVQTDMHCLPTPDLTADAVVSIFGPLSYSLKPKDLLVELMRVTKPGGLIALMPYTRRVEHKIALGSYSTATEDSIPKLFYTEQSLKTLLSEAGLEMVSVIGFNYAVNFFDQMSQDLGEPFNQAMLYKLMRLDEEFRSKVPAHFARHMVGFGTKPLS